MQRFLVVENTYHVVTAASNLEDSIVELYFRILVFQARALRYLDRHRASRILSDTFDPSRWENRLENIREQELECNKFLSDEIRAEMGRQSRNIDELREELKTSFGQQLDAIKVGV